MKKKLLYTIFALCLTGATIKAQCPVAYAGPNRTICQGDTITLELDQATIATAGLTVKWSTPLPPVTGILTFTFQPQSPVKFLPIGNRTDTTTYDTVRVIVGAPTPTFPATPPAPTTYKVMYTITSTGCAASTYTLSILVNPAPTATIVSPNGGGGFGGGGSTQTSCTGASTFTVTTRKLAAGTTGSLTFVAPGTAGTITQQGAPKDSLFIVTGLANGATALKWTVTNTTGGCFASSTTTLTVGSTLPTVAVAPSDISGCVGDNVRLLGSKATSGTPTWSNAHPPARGAGFPPPPAPKSITFVPNGNNDTVNVTLDTAGTFTLYYTIAIGTANVNNACTSRDSMQITVTKCGTGIAENKNGDLVVTIQPNPASNFFDLSLTDTKISAAEVSIIATDGRTVETEQLGSVKDIVKTINISTLSSGIYFVKVRKGDAIFVTKLVVQ
jgi:hypothetical protein